MAVQVTNKESGQTFTGKFADVRGGNVSLWSGVMSDRKGGFRGCGRKIAVFPEASVTVTADDPAREIKRA